MAMAYNGNGKMKDVLTQYTVVLLLSVEFGRMHDCTSVTSYSVGTGTFKVQDMLCAYQQQQIGRCMLYVCMLYVCRW